MRRTVLIHVADQYAFALFREFEGFGQGRRDFLNGHTHPASYNLAGLLQAIDDIQRNAAGNGKSNPLRPTRPGEDRRIDSDEFTAHIDQRAAGIAGVNRRVGLNEIFIVCNPDVATSQGTDDTQSHG